MKKSYLLVILILLSLLSLFIGVRKVSFLDVLKLENAAIRTMVLSRIPRLISLILAGMGMSISGLIMQQLSQNKFVSPTTAGTIDSAQLGILFSLIIFPAASPLVKMLLSFFFALTGSFLFMFILRKIKLKNTVIIPLIGIMMASIIGSISNFFAYRYNLVQSLSSWMQGNFSMVIKGRYELLYISVPLVILAYFYTNQFTIAGMGEDFAFNLGLNYKTIVNMGISIVALISSLVVITVGRIPFLGLIIPNLISIYYGDNLRKNIIPTALAGAVFLLFSDILSRIIIYPYEIPISLTVGILGSIIFLYLLFRRKA
ncbi:MAG TPA: iron chelate uptake ABC transporter family permease subunit [Halanaerobiales bacterium]|nr:iron chelate uptake ABC transporter family permease subunit [Halanaerobiales bacterium]